MQVCLRTNDILQNFTFYWSRKELENVEFRKRQLNKAVLSADFRPPRSKRVVRLARSELLAPLEASCSPRSERVTRPAPELPLHPERGVPPNLERDSTSAPSGTVPLSRARQYLCPERDSTSVPSGSVPLIRAERYP